MFYIASEVFLKGLFGRILMSNYASFPSYLFGGFWKGLEYELKKRRILKDPNIRIEKSAIVFPSVSTVCNASGWIQIGKSCQINEHCFIQAHQAGIKIGDDVLIGPFTVIHNGMHNFEKNGVPMREQGVFGRPIVIENDVWIGANCTIIGGVRIGAHSVIGAHSLVVGNIPPYSVAYGVPCEVRKSRNSC
jgi:acetyltransferase-like isoleucine patch superfamily enzyme